MPIDVLIARWVALLWLIFGLSHALYPAKWVQLLWPLRERDTGGFLLAGFSLPVGLLIILGHNLWIWDLAVIVTVVGWMTTLKCVLYLLVPRAHQRVMSTNIRPATGVRSVGLVMIVLGVLVGYDAFLRE